MEAAGDTRSIQVSDLGPTSANLHAGECSDIFTINLQASEWSSIARKVVKVDVCGKDDDPDS